MRRGVPWVRRRSTSDRSAGGGEHRVRIRDVPTRDSGPGLRRSIAVDDDPLRTSSPGPCRESMFAFDTHNVDHEVGGRLGCGRTEAQVDALLANARGAQRRCRRLKRGKTCHLHDRRHLNAELRQRCRHLEADETAPNTDCPVASPARRRSIRGSRRAQQRRVRHTSARGRGPVSEIRSCRRRCVERRKGVIMCAGRSPARHTSPPDETSASSTSSPRRRRLRERRR